MDELVKRLTEGNHPVVADRYKSVQELKAAIDRGYILLKFTNTQGETELGIQLDKPAANLNKANFGQSTGVVHLEGTLTLNYVQVRPVVELDLATLTGTGILKVIENTVEPPKSIVAA